MRLGQYSRGLECIMNLYIMFCFTLHIILEVGVFSFVYSYIFLFVYFIFLGVSHHRSCYLLLTLLFIFW